jgi:hypothetical protein
MTKQCNPDPRPTTYDEWWALEEERDNLRTTLDAANAELSRLRSSPAPSVMMTAEELAKFCGENPGFVVDSPVLPPLWPYSPAPDVGGVPDQEWNGPLLWELLRMDSDEPDWEDAAKRVHEWFASSFPALKPGEVVVREEEWRELRAFARVSGYPEGRFSFEVPFGRNMDQWGTDIARRLHITRDEEQAWLDSSAQATTTTEKEKDHG